MSRLLQGPARQVALLLLSLDRQVAATLLRHLPRNRVEDITRAMKELEGQPHDGGEVEAALDEFERRLNDGRVALGDVAAEADLVLEAAFGADDARAIRDRVGAQLRARHPFRELESLEPRDLATLCEGEQPQVAALLLAHLPPGRAARVLDLLADETRASVVARIAGLGEAPPGAVHRVVDSLLERVEELGLRCSGGEPESWLAAAGEILAASEHAGEVLDRVAQLDEDLAAGIRAEMYAFDDLGRLDRGSMQSLLGEIDLRTLALALKVTTAEVERNVVGNLSRRASAMVLEERDLLGPTPLREVRAAQQKVLDALHGLVVRGEVRVGDPTEPMV